MKKNKKGVSIVEAIVSMVIITIGIIGTYEIYFSALFLSDSAKNRIMAIEIAREGIEAVTNIRDTNWIRYGADYPNCWNVKDYDSSCLSNGSITYDIQTGSYIIFRDSTDKWFLSGGTLKDDYSNIAYKNFYKIKIDDKGFYTQSGGITMTGALFTREVIIDYLNTTGTTIDSNDEKMKVQSLVIWQDRASKDPHKIKLETIISNWKK